MRTVILAAGLLALGAAVSPGAHAAHRVHHAHRGHAVRPVQPATGERLELDPASGNYRIAYFLPGDPRGRGAALHHGVYVPATKIDPVVESEFIYRAEQREVGYRYRIRNGTHARQALVSVSLEPVSEISALALPPTHGEVLPAERIAQLEGTAATALASPASWSGTVRTSPAGGLRIDWRYAAGRPGQGLAPGRTQEGFGVPADDLPGIALARLSGAAPAPEFAGAWPDGDVGDRLSYLTMHDYITRPVAVPAVGIPDPYDPALLLDRIRDQTHTWVAISLLDPIFSAALDRHFTTAAAALRAGDTQGARFDLDAIRTELAAQQPSLQPGVHCAAPKAAQIGLLAARVLDFDLNYVMMRMGEGSVAAVPVIPAQAGIQR